MAANLLVKVMMDTTRIASGVDEVNSKLGKFGSSMTKIGAIAGGALASTGIVSFANDAMNAASDLNETISKSRVLFGAASIDVERFGDAAAKSIGQSKRSAIDAASTFAVFGKVAGLSGGNLVDFSTKLTGLASDLASFSNTTPEEAIQALGAALRGEMEPIRRYGVMLDDAAIRAEALAMKIYDGKGALTSQQKVLAVNSLIWKQTTDAQGDFARTADGAANRTRILNAQFENLKSTIGDKLLPIKMKLLEVGQKLIDWFQKLSPTMRNAILVAGGLVVAVGILTTAVGALAIAVNAATWPVLLIVGVIALLVAGFVVAYKKSETFRTVVDRVVKFFRNDFIPAVREGIAWLREKLAPVFVDVAATLVQAWGKFSAWWNENWPRIRQVIEVHIEAIKLVISTFIDVVKAAWSMFGDDLMTSMKGAWDVIAGTVMFVVNLIGGIISTFLALITGDWKGAWTAIKETSRELLGNLAQIFSGVFGQIRGIVGGAFDFMRSVAAGAFDFLLSLPSRLWALGGMLADVLGAAARAGINSLISDIERGVNYAIRGANRVANSLPFGGGFSIPEVSIPRMAKGGIVTSATLALIGEAGPEAVVPLSGANAPRMGGGTYNISVNVAPGANPADAGRAIVDAIRAFERSSGSGWRGAA